MAAWPCRRSPQICHLRHCTTTRPRHRKHRYRSWMAWKVMRTKVLIHRSDGAPADFNIPENLDPVSLAGAIKAFARGHGGNMLTITVSDPDTFSNAQRSPCRLQPPARTHGRLDGILHLVIPPHYGNNTKEDPCINNTTMDKLSIHRPQPDRTTPYQSGIADPRYPLLPEAGLEDDKDYELYKGLVDKQGYVAILKANVALPPGPN